MITEQQLYNDMIVDRGLNGSIDQGGRFRSLMPDKRLLLIPRYEPRR